MQSRSASAGSTPAAWSWFLMALLLQMALQNRRLLFGTFEPAWLVWAWAAALLLALLRPDDLKAHGLAWGLAIGYWLARMPLSSNHVLLLACVSACLLWHGVLRRRPGSTPEGTPLDAAVTRAAPTLRWLLVLTYLLAGFHKLNSGFFDPTFSCVNYVAFRLADLAGIEFAHGPLPTRLLAVATVLFEFAALLLLVGGRLAAGWLLLGLGFHVVAGLTGYFTFALLMFALFFLFLRLEQADGGTGRRRWDGVWLIAIATCWYVGRPLMRKYEVLVWLLLLLGLAVVAWRRGLRPTLRPLTRVDWRPVGAFDLLLLLLFVGNALQPYVGLKTTTAFSMFSNLRTEPGWHNHLLMPAGWADTFAYQSDLVDVHTSDLPALRPGPAGSQQWVYTEFRRIVREAQAVSDPVVAYTRGGQRWQLPGSPDPGLGAAESWLSARFLGFRTVTPALCQW